MRFFGGPAFALGPLFLLSKLLCYNTLMINFLHTFNPNAIAFSLGWVIIHWYGLFVVTGILAGLLAAVVLGKKYNITANQVFDLAFYLILAGIVGARVYSILLDWPYYSQNPAQIIAVWNGGLAIHGAILGGLAALIFYVKKHRQNFWQWADLAALALPLGQTFGRWGNYFNQEIFGTPTALPWGIPIEAVNRPAQYSQFQYFHPTFLYESILNLSNFLILVYIFKKTKVKPEIVFLIYLINYSLIRIAMEFLRTDSAPYILGIRWPVIFSLVVIVVCSGVFFYNLKKKPA